jgi:hypothetical protein
MFPWTANPGPVTQMIQGNSYNCGDHKNWDNFAIDFNLYLAPVSAIAPGVIVTEAWDNAGGWYAIVNHQNGYYSYYGHLSEFKKPKNATVREGDVIATSGDSAAPNNFHLHFSISTGPTITSTTVKPEPMGGLFTPGLNDTFGNYGLCGVLGYGWSATAPSVGTTSRYYTGDYFMDGYGSIHPQNGAPMMYPSDGATGWPGWNIARDFKLCRYDDNKGYILDGLGGIHSVGNATPVPRDSAHLDSWTWDIARSIVIAADCQSGFVLDGWGGVHPFAANGMKPALPNPAPTYWSGWDIARGIVLAYPWDIGSGGYTLDGWGGMHEFGGAPPVTVSFYQSGFDIARGVALTVDAPCCSGYTLDGWGGIHHFGPNATDPGNGYIGGCCFDVARGISMRGYWLNQPSGGPFQACGAYAGLYNALWTYNERGATPC